MHAAKKFLHGAVEHGNK